MIHTRQSLWDIFKRRLENIKQGAEQKGWVSTPTQSPNYSNPFLQSFAQKAQNYSNPFVNQMNKQTEIQSPNVFTPLAHGLTNQTLTQLQKNQLGVYAQGLKNIPNIGKGMTYTPPPAGLSPREQIKWNIQQSEEAKKAQLGIKTGLGTLQTFGESTVPGMTEKAIANLGYKIVKKPSPFLAQQDVIVPDLVKAGIDVAGFASDMVILNALTAPLSVKISSKLTPYFKTFHPVSTRILTQVPVDALKFATRGGLYETANELADGKFSPIKILQEATKKGAMGAVFGIGSAIHQPLWD